MRFVLQTCTPKYNKFYYTKHLKLNYNITAYSTALFSTWINVEELNLLIDAGDGVTAGLLQKSRKIKNVFVTHPDRDHLNGLPQFVQLNSRKDYPIIHYPKDSGSFPAMRDFLEKFDPHTEESKWIGIEDGQIIAIKKGFEVQAVRNEHIKSPIGIHKSLSYKLYETKSKLKPEFQNLDSIEIKKIVNQKGRDHITETHKKNIISFSGDTPVDDYAKWDGSQILIHEATFIKGDSDQPVSSHEGKHSMLEDVMKMVSEIEVDKLILAHFSARYSRDQIDKAIRKLAKELKIDIPVFAVYPGELKRNILGQNPINS